MPIRIPVIKMAIRNVLTFEDPQLRKNSREVTDFNERLHQLLDDLKDTLATQDGVGLAAPQVGVLRNAVVVLETNVEVDQEPYYIELVNPEIIMAEGCQNGAEGCLSVPGEFGIVTRPEKVRVRANDRFGNEFEVEGTGLTARCFCHEIDHLSGILFTDIAERMLTEEEIKSLSGDGEETEE